MLRASARLLGWAVRDPDSRFYHSTLCRCGVFESGLITKEWLYYYTDTGSLIKLYLWRWICQIIGFRLRKDILVTFDARLILVWLLSSVVCVKGNSHYSMYIALNIKHQIPLYYYYYYREGFVGKRTVIRVYVCCCVNSLAWLFSESLNWISISLSKLS